MSFRKNKKAELSQIFGVPDYAHGYFSQNFNGLFFRLMLWICIQNLKFAALPVPEIIGAPPKLGKSMDTPTLPFYQNF